MIQCAAARRSIANNAYHYCDRMQRPCNEVGYFWRIRCDTIYSLSAYITAARRSLRIQCAVAVWLV